MKRNQPMKTHINNLFLLPTLIAGLGLMLATSAPAQTFTTLHSFTGGRDELNPAAGLVFSGNMLYGTTSPGYFVLGSGTVFAVNTDGTGFTNLHTFTAVSSFPLYTNSDGAWPQAGLILSGNTLYGTASVGGTSGDGTVFKVNTDGMGFTNLYSFTGGSDGASPKAGLILSGNTLYGTAYRGGTNNNGTVFAVNAHGLGFTNLHTFTALSGSPFPTNSDGANTQAGLILSGNTLYGTANFGGTNGSGTVFALNTDGTGFTNLHTFASGSFNQQSYYTNSDGANPNGRLVLSGDTLYGTAFTGSTNGSGTVFAVKTNGTGFATLYKFSASGTNSSGVYTNSDGANPEGLILSGNTLYGTTSSGSTNGSGTVFAVNTNGTGFTTLYNFSGSSTNSSGVYTNSDGANPEGLILSGNTLYGTAPDGGSSGVGTVFSLSFPPPQLTIISSRANVILTWPTNSLGFSYAGYAFQCTTNLVSPAVWAAVYPAPVVVNGHNAVTNPVTGTQQFYRLSSP
jgi:uncharacterized repeat protein (TIGR03803 family)